MRHGVRSIVMAPLGVGIGILGVRLGWPIGLTLSTCAVVAALVIVIARSHRVRHGLGWLLRTYWPLLPTALVVVAVYQLYAHATFQPERDGKDAWLLFLVGAGFVLIVVRVVIAVRHWRWTDLGQLLTYAADGVIYTLLGLMLLGWHASFGRTSQNLFRTLVTVGMPLILIGLLWRDLDTKFGRYDEGTRWAWRKLRRQPMPARKD